MMLNSIIKSKQIIGKYAVGDEIGTLKIPDIILLAKKSIEEIQDLKFEKVSWKDMWIFGLTLNDGQSCKAGTTFDFD